MSPPPLEAALLVLDGLEEVAEAMYPPEPLPLVPPLPPLLEAKVPDVADVPLCDPEELPPVEDGDDEPPDEVGLEVPDDDNPEIVLETGKKLPYDVETDPSDMVLTAKDRDSVKLVTRPSESVVAKTANKSVLVEPPVLVAEPDVMEPDAEPDVVEPEADEVALELAAKTENEV